ncbi:hypothetical protein ISS08_00650 [Candidatus Pacearchaeota archaeon]|nr:hypothetical protein [Candidatus Pacearchaeota archaeon]
MKINFKKISAIGASVLLTGMTMGAAAAANYPAPFVSGGSANVATVYGAGASLDTAPAYELFGDLNTYVDAASTGVTGVTGQQVQIEKTSTKFHLGLGALDVRSTAITDSDMSSLLADGTYMDDDNEEFDFTQKVQIANSTLTMFEDSDYMDDVPTVGMKIADGAQVLNYTLTFSSDPYWKDMVSTNLNLMGTNYYILAKNAANTSLTLLDSAEGVTLEENTPVTVNGKTVSVSFIDADEVILNIDGVDTNKLMETETQKLTDGSYVGIKNILYDVRDGQLSSVEFSIGSGRLILATGTDVKMNDDYITGLSTVLSGTSQLSSIKLVWAANDDQFVTEDMEYTMPGFETLKMLYTGMVYPASESIKVENDGSDKIVLKNFPLKSGEADIQILAWDATNDWFDVIGEEASGKELLSTNATNLTYDTDLHDWVIASWSQGSDSESYLMKVSSISDATNSEMDKTTIQYYSDGSWVDAIKDGQSDDTFSLGNAEFTLGNVSNADNTVNFWRGNTNMEFDVLYSAEGMKVYLPWKSLTAVNITNNTAYATDALACAATGISADNRMIQTVIYYNSSTTEATGTCAEASVSIIFSEEDKDGNSGTGSNYTVTFTGTSDEVEVSGLTGYNSASTEIENTKVWRQFIYSALATESLWSKPTGAQKTLEMVYHGGESYGQVFVASSDATVEDSGDADATGNVVLKDSELTSGETANLIVVGGSCVNTAAAALLGVNEGSCGADWTTATGVGSGQFLIQSFGDSSLTSGVALLVAGYESADTVNAATYLRTQAVNTAAGNKYVGTSSVQAELVVE